MPDIAAEDAILPTLFLILHFSILIFKLLLKEIAYKILFEFPYVYV